MQNVELAGLFGDSKTFPDKPTVGTLNETIAGFNALGPTSNLTVGALKTYVQDFFKGEGLELETVNIENFTANPAILDSIEDQIYRGFVAEVNSYWALLIRQTNESALCTDGKCDSSLIPLNHTIVVPGGRYREIYYWDSFWILEGLLSSELNGYAWNLLQNFMDLIDLYGFLPNGGRKYYLNRSQPPVFVQMVNAYVQKTGNTTILERALPIMETELEWWRENRTISVTSPFTGKNYSVAHFAVDNSAPRPEGYVEDITTAFGAEPPLDAAAREELWAELASGAESGWDYSSRWCKEPVINISDNNPALRTLNVRAMIPVDLNSLLYGDHVLLADLYDTFMNSTAGTTNSSQSGGSNNMTAKVDSHRLIASELKEAILDLNWDADKLWFYDYNMTASNRSDVYMAGGTFPLWQNITPAEITQNETAAQQVFAGQRYIAGKYAGIPSVASVIETGLNWDFPNAWPPHVYTSIKALETLGRLYPNASSFQGDVVLTDFGSIPEGQLGLTESELQRQPADAIGNNSVSFAAEVSSIQKGKPWWQQFAIEHANRYLQASFCSWYSTGGSIPNLLASITASQPDSNGTTSSTTSQLGNIFEKFNATDVDAAGGGGEYEVVIGFGWTNGVILHTAGEYGQYLAVPKCPLLDIVVAGSGGGGSGSSGNPYAPSKNNSRRSTIYQGIRKH